MTTRPILFNGPMVRAILDGRKTQTRRVIKQAINVYGNYVEVAGEVLPARETGWVAWFPGGNIANLPEFTKQQYAEGFGCPYGTPGDRLWVRHAFNLFPVYFKSLNGWPMYAAGTDGHIYRMDRGEPLALRGSMNSKGYLTVSLSNGHAETHHVHRLVCEAFYGAPPFDGAQVRHMDGNRANNLPANLDWGTQEDNWQDRKAHGRGMGERHHAAKLTMALADEIRASSLSIRQAAEHYGVAKTTVWQIRAGLGWTEHAPGPRNTEPWIPWVASIHMPRWASRLTLAITDVRVQRLQDITTREIEAEGVLPDERYLGCANRYRHAFSALWDGIYARRGYGWEANPWVWVITFTASGL